MWIRTIAMVLLVAAQFAAAARAGDVISELAGDFNGDGAVGNADLTLLLDNWGAPVPPSPAGWVTNLPTPPAVNNDELTRLSDSWGTVGQIAENVDRSGPEPAVLLLVGIAVSAILYRRWRSCQITTTS